MTNNNVTNLDHFNHRVRRLFSNVHNIIKIIKYDSYFNHEYSLPTTVLPTY